MRLVTKREGCCLYITIQGSNMLSRSSTAAIRARVCRPGAVRLNSTAGKPSKKSEKPFYNTFAEFVRTSKLNSEGAFIHEIPTEQQYEHSELAKYLKKVDSEKESLIDAKLKELAQESGIPFEQVKEKFERKLKEKQELLKSRNQEVVSKIENFMTQLSLPMSGPQSIIIDLIDTLGESVDELNSFAAFEYIYELDPDFAKALSNVLRVTPTEESVKAMSDAFKEGPMSKLSDEQYNELKQLLDTKAKVTKSTENEAEVAEKETVEEEEEGEIDANSVVEVIFAHLNSYENIANSPLLKVIESIDSDFATMLKSYETIDPSDSDALENKFEEIVKYCSNTDSSIYKAFGDSTSPNFTRVQEVLEGPIPIDLAEIYEVFEFYPDYFKSELYKQISTIDPQFAQLLEKLESLPEGKELDEVNDEVDAHLINKESPIYKAMNDVESEDYAKLKSTLESEWNVIETTVTPDKLVEYVISNGLESDGFKLIQKIDPGFADVLAKIYQEDNEEGALKAYTALQNYLENENEIMGALQDKDSLNYKLLADYVFPEAPEANEQEDDVAEIETSQRADVIQRDEVLSQLANEDKSKLTPEVVKINEAYDLTLEIMKEIEDELKDNTFIPVSRQVSAKLDKMLGFQPSVEQVTASENLRSIPQPKQTDEVLELAVNIIMKDGKKEIARKNLNRALYLLFLETRSNPVEKLKEALDIVAPLVITKTVKTGFAKNYTVPVPLTQRQRNRMALLWILKASDSKASNDFSVRLCDEVLHVLSGKSALMEKRVLNHKMAIANRSYLSI